MRVLITGSEGFAGSHLVDHCLSMGDEVWGTCRPGTRASNLSHCLDQITLRVGDLAQPDFMRGILREAHFDVVFHLAAISVIHDAQREPARTYEVNLLGAIHLLEAVRTQSPRTRVVVVSSAEVYGPVKPENLPVTEDQPFAPGEYLRRGQGGDGTGRAPVRAHLRPACGDRPAVQPHRPAPAPRFRVFHFRATGRAGGATARSR